MVGAADLERKGVYRAGGISAILIFVLYIVIIAIYAVGGATLPPTAEEWFKHLETHATDWWLITSFSAVTDFLFLPLLFALYVALKDVDRNTLLFGIGLKLMFVVLELALSFPNFSTLIMLSGKYAASASEAERAAYLAAATHITVEQKSPILAFYASFTPALGTFIIGLVMLKSRGIFSKTAAYLAFAGGFLGMLSVVGAFFVEALGQAIILGSLIIAFWNLLVGMRLLKLE